MVTRVRSDALPEGFDYPDQGCDLAPACLFCPLIRCRYDPPYDLRRHRALLRARQVYSLSCQGYSWRRIARLLGVSLRTVARDLKIPVGALLAAPPDLSGGSTPP